VLRLRGGSDGIGYMVEVSNAQVGVACPMYDLLNWRSDFYFIVVYRLTMFLIASLSGFHTWTKSPPSSNTRNIKPREDEQGAVAISGKSDEGAGTLHPWFRKVV
jgi:hypothetical protein